MIPKKIHYCWFGNNPKSELVMKCIESWKKYCPDWEIIEWNESNVDIDSIAYMNEAYKNKKWAFVSDVARLDIIYKNGGIYLDTDVELKKSLDEWLIYDSIFVFETERNVNTGLGFGAQKGHKYIKAILESYKKRHFEKGGKLDITPCPNPNTEILMQNMNLLVRNGKTQKYENNIVISGEDYSYYAKHYGAQSWSDGPKWERKKEYKNTKLKRYLRTSKQFNRVEKYMGKKAVKIYTFLVYDLLEVGLLYYIKRIINKIMRKFEK